MKVYTIFENRLESLDGSSDPRTLVLGASFKLRTLDNGRHFIAPLVEHGADGAVSRPGVEVSNCLLTAPNVTRQHDRFGNGATYTREWLTVLDLSIGRITPESDSYILMRDSRELNNPGTGALFWVPGIDLILDRAAEGVAFELMQGLYYLAPGASITLDKMIRRSMITWGTITNRGIAGPEPIAVHRLGE